MCLIHLILTSLVILPLLFLPVKTRFYMFLLLTIHQTHQMSVYHYIIEMTHIPLKIYPFYHLSFLKTQRANILAFHLPLCTVDQIMRIPTNISNFLIMDFVIFILHLMMMLIHLFLISLSHQSPKIYLLLAWKPSMLSRHFNLG